MKLYDNLYTQASPHITDYRRDLTEHDRAAIAANPGRSFVHATRPSGTHIYFLPLPTDNPRQRYPICFGTGSALDAHRTNLRAMEYIARDSRAVWHYACATDGTVRRVDTDRAIEMVRDALIRLKNSNETPTTALDNVVYS